MSKIGRGSVWAALAQKRDVRPPIFFLVLGSTLDVLCTCKVRKKILSFAATIQGSNLKIRNFGKKFPKNWGEGGGPPVLKLK